MAKRALTTIEKMEKYRRRLRLVLIIFTLFIILTAVFVYINYDILAFKYFITKHYAYPDDLEKMYANEGKK